MYTNTYGPNLYGPREDLIFLEFHPLCLLNLLNIISIKNHHYEVKVRYDRTGTLYNDSTIKRGASFESIGDEEYTFGSSTVEKRSRLENNTLSTENNNVLPSLPSNLLIDDGEGNDFMNQDNDESSVDNQRHGYNNSNIQEHTEVFRINENTDGVERIWSQELGKLVAALISFDGNEGGPNLEETLPYFKGECTKYDPSYVVFKTILCVFISGIEKWNIGFCKCKKEYETLIHRNLFPATPSNSVIASHISFLYLEFYEHLNNSETIRRSLSNAYFGYEDIKDEVEKQINLNDYECPVCPKQGMRIALDGNIWLRRCKRNTDDTKHAGALILYTSIINNINKAITVLMETITSITIYNFRRYIYPLTVIETVKKHYGNDDINIIYGIVCRFKKKA
ncbi:hypothetical protein BDA99DRAFT_533479 [Phascolomyces articulosus]|uniref:Uncharacterized protein n=1 Tax=Phascolomyces articulosus TaxID=60185 RepID=A0AAD5PJ02_9FUNG|nr:hypothetical protein BDA99DRAFT_533479 [Phascolomyces articulosus]